MRSTTAALALAGTTALTIASAPASAGAEPLPNTVSVHEKALLAPVAGQTNPRRYVRAVRREVAQDRAVRRTLRLARRAGGGRVPRRVRLRLARDTRAGLAARRVKLRARIRAARWERAGAPSAALSAIAACESGSNPAAVDASGTYYGKYQFDLATWQSVGGTGNPAAAPEGEQDARAAMLYARAGASPWPVCGR